MITVKCLKPISHGGYFLEKGQIAEVSEDFVKAAGEEYLEVQEKTGGDEEVDLTKLKLPALKAKAIELGIAEDVANAAKKDELIAMIQEKTGGDEE